MLSRNVNSGILSYRTIYCGPVNPIRKRAPLKACVQESILFYLTKPAWETGRSYSKCSISLLSQSDKVMLRRRKPARNHLFLTKNVRPTLDASNLPTGATSSRKPSCNLRELCNGLDGWAGGKGSWKFGQLHILD